VGVDVEVYGRRFDGKPRELMLEDLKAKYDAQAASPAFSRLYDDEEFGHMFAVLQRRFNQHFDAINDRAKSSRHY
jgi:hypothetical protein